MRIRLRDGLLLGSRFHDKGKVVEVADDRARRLIEGRLAVRAESGAPRAEGQTEPPPPPAPAEAATDVPTDAPPNASPPTTPGPETPGGERETEAAPAAPPAAEAATQARPPRRGRK